MTDRAKRRLLKFGAYPAFLVVAWLLSSMGGTDSTLGFGAILVLTLPVYLLLLVKGTRPASDEEVERKRRQRAEADAEVRRWMMHDSNHSLVTLWAVRRGVRRAQRRGEGPPFH